MVVSSPDDRAGHRYAAAGSINSHVVGVALGFGRILIEASATQDPYDSVVGLEGPALEADENRRAVGKIEFGDEVMGARRFQGSRSLISRPAGPG